ncbi:MAG: NAD(P)/FAD-dependent oxidoreductase [Mycoplasmataceae bacterium]|jgi:thioredoxin reductase (NADPH)|nr:NAD(P)/FAD-dependent oxidoreductase [Mycoplasmataceae bacterium]
MLEPILDCVIIGAGPIGLYCGNQCKKNNLSFLIIEKSHDIGGQITSFYPQKKVYDYPNHHSIMSSDIVKNLKKSIEQNILTNSEIKNIKNDKKANQFTILFKNNDKQIKCKSIVICIGVGKAEPKKIDFETDNTSNIFYQITNKDDFKQKKLIVLGGGDSAVDWADQLEEITQDVTIVYRRPEFRNNRDTKPNVKKYLNYSIKKAQNNILHIFHNETKKEELVPYDYLFVFFGLNLEPITHLLKYKTKQDKIIIDKNQQTNINNVYAAGDCCFGKKEYKIASGMEEVDKIISNLRSKI